MHTCHGGIAAAPALVAAVPAVDECGTNGLCGAGVVAKRTVLSQNGEDHQSNFLGSSMSMRIFWIAVVLQVLNDPCGS